MSGKDSYILLVSSLPDLGGFLEAHVPPISRSQIEERLGMLSSEDRAELEAMVDVLSWEHLRIGDDDATVLARADKVMASLSSETLRHLFRDRLEIRTVITALRKRYAGEDAPAPQTPWGYGRFRETIRANWSDPAFGISRAFPWVIEARDKLESGDTAGMERIILKAVWDSIDRYADNHTFDLEAVAIYLLRWSVVDNWAHYDTAAATTRFSHLLDEALTDAIPTFEAVP